MSSSPQPEKHLNADGFSAFVDNAMSEDERLDVIAHIADCEQCREIIVLLQETSSSSEVPGASPAMKRHWFALHPLLGAATAALAAVIVTSAAFVAQNKFGQRNQRAGTIPSLSAANVPPAPPISPQVAPLSRGVPRSSATTAASPSKAPDSKPTTLQKSTQPYNSQIADAADALHLNAADDETGTLDGSTGDNPSHDSGQWKANPLPSGLPAIAKVSRVHYNLAADTNGDLFLSYDGGGHWKHIPKQWKGNIVRLATSSGPAAGQSLTTTTLPNQNGKVPILSANKARFELTTDTGGVWISQDGTHWRPL